MALSTIGTNSIADSAVTSAKASGLGITMADQWRLTSGLDVASGVNDITANLSQVSGDGFGVLGSSMTESSGIFTFPSTGIYLITAHAYIFRNSGAAEYVGITIKTTTDNSSYGTAAQSYGNVENTTNEHSEATVAFQFDVTNTSTHKVKFSTDSSDNNTVRLGGSSSQSQTFFTFIRLGDT
jgi:hypothetical protein